MSRERVGIEDVSDLCRQSVKTVTHADRLACQINLGPWGKLDHAVAFSADSTRCSARSLTKASTRNRVPSTRSISIKPGRMSGNPPAERAVGDARAITDGAVSTRSAGPPSSPRANTPIGTKLVFSVAGLAAGSRLARYRDVAARGRADGRHRFAPIEDQVGIHAVPPGDISHRRAGAKGFGHDPLLFCIRPRPTHPSLRRVHGRTDPLLSCTQRSRIPPADCYNVH